MNAHRCKFPNAAKYQCGVLFSCDCGRSYVLSAVWTEKRTSPSTPGTEPKT